MGGNTKSIRSGAIKNNFIYPTTNYTVNQLFNLGVSKLNLLFAFYIYSVDKQIYKNSRGRSGKYTFVWKYIPVYKRNRLASHWVSKEVKITTGRTIFSRIKTVLSNFFNNLGRTWIWKIKKFSLNYVYYNLRKSLAENYKTSLK